MSVAERTTVAVYLRGRSLAERFWARVDRRGADECWPWTGARVDGRKPYAKRYGVLRRGATDGCRRVTAHRLAYELLVGPIPAGLHVLHTCDNPPCCNPAHLWIGTHADNMADRKAKGGYA